MDRMRAYFQVWNPAKEHIMQTGTVSSVQITKAVFFLSLSFGSYRITQIPPFPEICGSWQKHKKKHIDFTNHGNTQTYNFNLSASQCSMFIAGFTVI